jgi:hypothetical protein
MKPHMDTYRPRMNERQVRYWTGLSSIMPSSFSTVESARAGVGACEENRDSEPGLNRAMRFPTPIVNRPDWGIDAGQMGIRIRMESKRGMEKGKKNSRGSEGDVK